MNGGGGGDGGRRSQAPPPGSEIDAALQDLNRCVDRVQALIPRVHAVVERRQVSGPRRPTSPRIIYGGGPSVFVRGGSPPSQPGPRRADPEAPQASVDPGLHPPRQLLVAADLALAGYSMDEIDARLRTRRDPDATIAIDDAFE